MSVRRIGVGRRTPPWDRLIGGTLLTQQLADGPAALWALQDTTGSVLADASGNGRTLTHSLTLAQTPLIGGMTYSARFPTAGVIASAYQSWMDGSDFTLEVAASGETWSTSPVLWRKRSNSALQNHWSLWVGADGKLNFQINRPTTSTATTLAGIATDSAHLIAATCQYGGNITIYLDGAEVATTAAPASGDVHTSVIHLGVGTSSNSQPFTGRMSNAAYYGTALSSTRLLAHAQAAGLA